MDELTIARPIVQDMCNFFNATIYADYRKCGQELSRKKTFGIIHKQKIIEIDAKDESDVDTEDESDVHAEDEFNVHAEDEFHVHTEDEFNVHAEDKHNVHTEAEFDIHAEDNHDLEAGMLNIETY